MHPFLWWEILMNLPIWTGRKLLPKPDATPSKSPTQLPPKWPKAGFSDSYRTIYPDEMKNPASPGPLLTKLVIPGLIMTASILSTSRAKAWK